MFEKMKNWFKSEVDVVDVVDVIEMQAHPIEINLTPDFLRQSRTWLSRNEARLDRLLTIIDPSEEIKAEIERRQKEL